MNIWQKYKDAERRRQVKGTRYEPMKSALCPANLALFLTIKGKVPHCTLPNDGHWTHDDTLNQVRWESPSEQFFQKIEVY